jgi:hypothetical protein
MGKAGGYAESYNAVSSVMINFGCLMKARIANH